MSNKACSCTFSVLTVILPIQSGLLFAFTSESKGPRVDAQHFRQAVTLLVHVPLGLCYLHLPLSWILNAVHGVEVNYCNAGVDKTLGGGGPADFMFQKCPR